MTYKVGDEVKFIRSYLGNRPGEALYGIVLRITHPINRYGHYIGTVIESKSSVFRKGCVGFTFTAESVELCAPLPPLHASVYAYINRELGT